MARLGDMTQNRFVVLIFIACLSFQVQAASDMAGEWLDRMNHAVRNLNYEGTFVYMHDNQLEAMQITHVKDENGQRERLFSLNGESREILRNNELLTCIWPSTKAVLIDKTRQAVQLPVWFDSDRKRLTKHYTFETMSGSRVAGYETQIIQIKPLDQYRYGYRLWVTLDNAMLVKSDMLDEAGKSLEQLMFTDLKIVENASELSVQQSFSTVGFSRQKPKDANSILLGVKDEWVFEKMPHGFYLDSAQRRVTPGQKNAVQHMVFSDGLATVSVFIEKAEAGEKTLHGVSTMGAVNAYGAEAFGHHVTVVGEVPEATVRLIGESVNYVVATNK